jgi:hypothetical protein
MNALHLHSLAELPMNSMFAHPGHPDWLGNLEAPPASEEQDADSQHSDGSDECDPESEINSVMGVTAEELGDLQEVKVKQVRSKSTVVPHIYKFLAPLVFC